MTQKSLALAVSLASFSFATVLGDLAASLQPKTWAKLANTGLTTATLGDGGIIVTITGNSANWDPIREQFTYVGSYHAWPLSHLCYKASTNRWTTLSTPFNYGGSHISVGHGYDHNTIDAVRGIPFYRENNRGNIYQYHASSNTWSSLPSVSGASTCGCGGMAYFPEYKGLVLFDPGYGGIRLLRDGAAQWSTVSVNTACSYHGFAEYNPVHKVVVFGGGNGCRELFKIDSLGIITKMKNAPISLGTYMETIETADPVSGDFLFLNSSGSFYAYNVLNDTWQAQSGPLPIFNSPLIGGSGEKVMGIILAPVSTYGVVMFLRPVYGYDPEIWIYKHSPSTRKEPSASPRTPVTETLEVIPNPVTRDRAKILISSPLSLKGKMKAGVYDSRGRKIAAVEDGTWDAGPAPSGVYVVKAAVGSRVLVKRIVKN